MNAKINIEDWGLIDYETAWQMQKELVKKCRENPDLNFLVMCEHPSVITIGRAGTKNNIISSKEFLSSNNIKVVSIERGGDVTLHNPGQLVGYPVFNLANFTKDLHWFLREIEECIIELLKYFNLDSDRVPGLTGVWIEGKRKICAIGLHCSNWIISHGFALNVNNNLNEFNHIIPCGITNKEVTSIEKELSCKIDFDEVRNVCLKIFLEHFLK